MASERVQRRIDSLLDQIEEELTKKTWIPWLPHESGAL